MERWLTLNKVLDIVDRIIGIMMIALISVMLIVGSAQVFCRYALHNSLSWSEELMRFLYVWIVMVGINLGIRHKSLAAITSLSDTIAKRSVAAGRIMAIVCFVVQLFACAMLFWFGLKFTLANKQVSPALRINMSIIYAALPVGGGMSVIYTINEIIDWCKEVFKRE